MPIPKQHEIERPLLQVLHALGGQASPRDVYGLLEQRFDDLTEADKAEVLTAGMSRWRNRVQFVRQNLVQQGLLDPSERGVWRLTAAGKLRAEHDGPAAATAREGAADESVSAHTGARPSLERTESALATTEAALGNAKAALFAQLDLYRQAQHEWMLARLAKLSWRELEQLTGHVLARCGLDNVVVTPGSHDGSIDGHGTLLTGIVRLRVAFQCKHQVARVDRPQIDKFRGAIQGDYDQGIFVSLSEFTAGAKEASSKRGTVRIELIDGDDLVRKMLDTGIGATREELHVFEGAAFPAGDP
jgi:restriction system protein